MALGHGPRVVTDGLVLALDAGDTNSYPGSGTTWYNLSGQGSNGALINGSTFGSINGGAIQTDSTNDYINIGGGLPTGDAWSFNIWFLIDGPTSFTQTGHRTFLSTNNFRFQWDDTSSTSIARGPFIDFTDDAGGEIAQYSTTLSPSDIFNRWHMTSVTSDGSTIKVYYDASTDGVGSTEIAGSRNFSTNAAASLGIDNRSGQGGTDIFNRDGGNTYFSNISIYNRALTASEVKQNFNALRGRFGI
jgi:hypothetical protein